MTERQDERLVCFLKQYVFFIIRLLTIVSSLGNRHWKCCLAAQQRQNCRLISTTNPLIRAQTLLWHLQRRHQTLSAALQSLQINVCSTLNRCSTLALQASCVSGLDLHWCWGVDLGTQNILWFLKKILKTVAENFRRAEATKGKCNVTRRMESYFLMQNFLNVMHFYLKLLTHRLRSTAGSLFMMPTTECF